MSGYCIAHYTGRMLAFGAAAPSHLSGQSGALQRCGSMSTISRFQPRFRQPAHHHLHRHVGAGH